MHSSASITSIRSTRGCSRRADALAGHVLHVDAGFSDDVRHRLRLLSSRAGTGSAEPEHDLELVGRDRHAVFSRSDGAHRDLLDRPALERLERARSARGADCGQLAAGRQPAVERQRRLLALGPVERADPSGLQARARAARRARRRRPRPRPRPRSSAATRRRAARGAVSSWTIDEHRLRLGAGDLRRLAGDARSSSAAHVLADQRVQLVLEAAALDRAVDAALLGRVRLPPPAARRGSARPAPIARVHGAQPIEV